MLLLQNMTTHKTKNVTGVGRRKRDEGIYMEVMELNFSL
jgi:hypothetical protein